MAALVRPAVARLGQLRSLVGPSLSGARPFATDPWKPPKPLSKITVPGVQHIVVIASGKGGVGKSTTAVNIATSLARVVGLRVGLFDADVFGPSVGHMMSLSGKPLTGDDGRMIPLTGHGVRCMSMSFLMSATNAAVWRGPMVMSALETFMTKVAWEPLDVLLIDMPPGTGDAQLTVCQRLHLSGAVIISTPQDVALIDARRGITAFSTVGVPILGCVQNMSVHVCDECGHETHLFGEGGVEKTAEELGVPLLGSVPLELNIRESADAGTPIAVAQPDSPAARAYADIATRIWQRCQEVAPKPGIAET